MDDPPEETRVAKQLRLERDILRRGDPELGWVPPAFPGLRRVVEGFPGARRVVENHQQRDERIAEEARQWQGILNVWELWTLIIMVALAFSIFMLAIFYNTPKDRNQPRDAEEIKHMRRSLISMSLILVVMAGAYVATLGKRHFVAFWNFMRRKEVRRIAKVSALSTLVLGMLVEETLLRQFSRTPAQEQLHAIMAAGKLDIRSSLTTLSCTLEEELGAFMMFAAVFFVAYEAHPKLVSRKYVHPLRASQPIDLAIRLFGEMIENLGCKDIRLVTASNGVTSTLFDTPTGAACEICFEEAPLFDEDFKLSGAAFTALDDRPRAPSPLLFLEEDERALYCFPEDDDVDFL